VINVVPFAASYPSRLHSGLVSNVTELTKDSTSTKC
jgi:hypothetical protein